jgi:hypothetical protein
LNRCWFPVAAKGKNGRPATGLTQADFTISEEGKKQTITSFSVEPVPILCSNRSGYRYLRSFSGTREEFFPGVDGSVR